VGRNGVAQLLDVDVHVARELGVQVRLMVGEGDERELRAREAALFTAARVFFS
jgi:hypothetical protein